MPVVACLWCPIDECPKQTQPMPLPVSTLQHKPLNPEEWPNDKELLYAACPDCRQVSAHLRFVLWNLPDFPSGPHADKSWLRISFRCAVEDCKTPVQFHTLVIPTAEPARNEWREKLASGYWRGVSPCGHPIAITNDQKVGFAWVQGRMQGYNLADPLWSTL